MLSKFKTLLKYIRGFLSRRSLKYHMLDDEQTLFCLENEDKGLIRWGDGETNIAIGFSIKTNGEVYQKCDTELRRILLEIVEGYSADAKYLLALPNAYLSKDNRELSRAERIIWANTRFFFKHRVKKSIPYADAFIFRNAILHNSNRSQLIRSLVRKRKNVIIVSGNPIYDDQIAEALSEKNTHEVLIPERNAFSVCDKILDEIAKKIMDNGLTSEDTCLLIGGGPAGKVIAYRFAQQGFVCYDLGFLLNPAPIEKKYNVRNAQE